MAQIIGPQYIVPDDYATIQEAIDAADNVYEIIVKQGTYVLLPLILLPLTVEEFVTNPAPIC